MTLKASKQEATATETYRIGSREFRENFATILVKAEGPVAITRHGDTVGYYIPARPRRSDDEKEALTHAVAKLHGVLAANGITEEEIMEELKRVQANEGEENSQTAQAK
jgi:antitoxin (DNA-binding transcriptional repressor) of toxin-antitoxin stability system